jgi:hypothetical protein
MDNMKEFSSSSYCVFSLVMDEMRGTSTPVGVALWTRERGKAWIKLAGEDDRIRGLNKISYFYIAQVQKQLNQWVESGELPYGDRSQSLGSDDWWRHLSSLLVHKLRMSEPRPIDCQNPADELEPLYEAVVGPRRGMAERSARIDGVLSTALGRLSKELDKGEVAGYRGRPVPVRHFKSAPDRLLIVEAVNLASVNAETDTDALVSKLLRVRAAKDRSASVVTCVGYLASPSGLNGEGALVDWIKEKADAHIFDLLNEREKFKSAVGFELANINPQQYLR